MSRMDNKHYEQRVMLAMLVYMVVLIGTGPLMHATARAALKALLAILPAVPIFYVIALMWRRIRDSDELEQRTHLVALGAAVAVVSGVSVVGGFLAIGGVVALGGDVLIWVFPALMACYGIAQQRVARRYGMGDTCAEAGSPWLPWFFAGMTGLMAAGAGIGAYRHELAGAAGCLLSAAIFALAGFWAWRRRARALREEQP